MDAVFGEEAGISIQYFLSETANRVVCKYDTEMRRKYGKDYPDFNEPWVVHNAAKLIQKESARAEFLRQHTRLVRQEGYALFDCVVDVWSPNNSAVNDLRTRVFRFVYRKDQSLSDYPLVVLQINLTLHTPQLKTE